MYCQLHMNRTQNLDIFYENIENILYDAKSVKTIFMCGDLNVDLLKHEDQSSTKHLLDLMHSLGIYLLIDKPARITESSAALTDNIFTKELQHNPTCGILFNGVSDHLPVFALCDYHINRNASLSNELSA